MIQNLVQRVLIGALLLAVFLGLVYLGGWAFWVLVSGFLGLALWEYLRITQPGRLWPALLAVVFQVGLFAWSQALLLAGQGLGRVLETVVTAFLVCITLYFLLWMVLFRQETFRITRDMLFGHLYIGVPGVLALWIRQQGLWPLLYPALVVFVFDSLALFFGIAFGRHPLAPRVSPRKTWEGFLLGWLVTVPVALLLPGLPWAVRVWTALLIPPVAQVSDLAESALKRLHRLKDSSTLFGAHGGALDRVDSLLLVIPWFFVILRWLGGAP